MSKLFPLPIIFPSYFASNTLKIPTLFEYFLVRLKNFICKHLAHPLMDLGLSISFLLIIHSKYREMSSCFLQNFILFLVSHIRGILQNRCNRLLNKQISKLVNFYSSIGQSTSISSPFSPLHITKL